MYELENACNRFEAKLVSLDYDADIYMEGKDTRSLFTRLKQFIARLLASIVSFKNDISATIDLQLKKRNLQNNMKALKERALVLKRSGKNYISCPDFKAYAQRQQQYLKDVNKLVSKFKSVNYRKAYDVTEDLQTFDAITRTAEADLQKILKTDKAQTVDHVIEMCEHELQKKGIAIQTIADTEKTIRDFKAAAADIEKKAEIMGDDIVYLRIGAIQKISAATSRCLRNTVGSFLARVIMILGFIF